MASTSKTFNKVTGYLKKITGIPEGEIFFLTPGEEVIIGRHRQAVKIWIQDCNISRTHCALKNQGNNWFIKDLKSMNRTFVDRQMLNPGIFYPLKDGAIIHLGPPEEAPVAFVFQTKISNVEINEGNKHSINERNGEESSRLPVLILPKSIKRSSDPKDSGTEENSSPRKKIATSSSSPPPPSSRVQDFFEEKEDDANLSDCSISSLDSLKTRVRKLSAKKNSKYNLRNKDTKNAASTSASPQLRQPSNSNFESKPSTSALPSEMCDRQAKKVLKPSISKEFALLNTLFNESDSSNSETIKGEDSQSLLNESKILIDCEPYPFSQPLPAESEQTEQNRNKVATEKKESLREQLEAATLELKKLKKDKLYLSRLVKELKSDEFLKKKFQVEFQKLLEDELMCNICTEVILKAITLGCSHTFCEYCISEWKKKQKKCPICREKITSETKILVLDSFITKAVEHLDTETQTKRKELSATREKAKVTQQKKGKRSRGRNQRTSNRQSSNADEVQQIHGESSNNIGVQIRFSRNISPSIQFLPNEIDFDAIMEMSSDSNSDLSDESDSDSAVEGDGYFGGYGRCYSCGRRGHWANGCPYT